MPNMLHVLVPDAGHIPLVYLCIHITHYRHTDKETHLNTQLTVARYTRYVACSSAEQSHKGSRRVHVDCVNTDK